MLQQAATITPGADGSYEMYDYVVALREGIMDAWGGIIGAMKSSGKSMFLFLTAGFALVADIFSCSRRPPALRPDHLRAPQQHLQRY